MTKQQLQRKLQLRQGMIEFAGDEYEATKIAKECAELRREIRRMTTRETAQRRTLRELSDPDWQAAVMHRMNRASTAYTVEGVK